MCNDKFFKHNMPLEVCFIVILNDKEEQTSLASVN